MGECVENELSGKVMRVTDDEAHEMTEGGSPYARWFYVPKKYYKLRKANKTKEAEEYARRVFGTNS